MSVKRPEPTVFKTRIGVLALLFGAVFLSVLCRLWQLQVVRYEKYATLAAHDRDTERIIPAPRSQIVDRDGNVWAEDRVSYDLSVRADRLRLRSVRLDDLKAIHKRYGDLKRQAEKVEKEGGAPLTPQVLKSWQDEREAQVHPYIEMLKSEPFVRDLALTLKRDDEEIARGLFKALDAVTRDPPWASMRTPLRIAGDVDEKTWLALRSVHEDVFRDPSREAHKLVPASMTIGAPEDFEAPHPTLSPGRGETTTPHPAISQGRGETIAPFPGLVCSVSARRVYPHGRSGCFVVGALGERTPDEDELLRRESLLIENAAARERLWSEQRRKIDPSRAEHLETLLGQDPRDIGSAGQLYLALKQLGPQQRRLAADLGLAEAVQWLNRPPRMQLTEPEALYLACTRSVLPDRRIGELGLERFYNDVLRGKCGLMVLESVEDSTEGEENLDYKSNSRPKEGQTVAMTISLKWQTAVEAALKSVPPPVGPASLPAGTEAGPTQPTRGAAIVLDVRTGEVLALVSMPDFDPNLFSPPRDGFQRQQELKAVLSDPAKPLLNRAISEHYPLGSVMKALVAAVALERGVTNLGETYECHGFFVEGGQKFRCDDSRAHGSVDLTQAIRRSCNGMFCQLGGRLGVENLGPYAKCFFGRRTGIDLPGEVSGIYPDREWRAHAYSNPAMRAWTRGSDYQLAIGQGQMTSTVIQAAVLMAAISNGGNVVTPRVWLDAPATPARPLGISQTNLQTVRAALEEVCNIGQPGARGTAYSPFHEQGPELAVRVAGKTSTAEHRQNLHAHAWFAGYAPADNPQVAFAVLIEEGGHGGATAAPVAYKFLKEIYGTRR